MSGLHLSGEPTAPKASRPGLAMVVQRYGQEVTGGSESLCRAVAERLASDYRVTVFTTCATDYVTWRNALPEGTQEIEGVEVVRFPVEEERDLDAFNRFAEPLYLRATTRAEELLFLRRQGPYVPQLALALGGPQGRVRGGRLLHLPLLPDGARAGGGPRAGDPGAHDPR